LSARTRPTKLATAPTSRGRRQGGDLGTDVEVGFLHADESASCTRMSASGNGGKKAISSRSATALSGPAISWLIAARTLRPSPGLPTRRRAGQMAAQVAQGGDAGRQGQGFVGVAEGFAQAGEVQNLDAHDNSSE
jgi:hypothetical protein